MSQEKVFVLQCLCVLRFCDILIILKLVLGVFKMNQYVEVLVKQNVEKKKQKRKIITIVLMAVFLITGIMTAIPLCFFLAIGFGIIFWFAGLKYQLEFEYYYLDGELTISKIINQARRKNMMELNGGEIKLVAPKDSDEASEYRTLRCMDCSANDADKPPYVLICEHKGNLKKVLIQMNDELYKEMKRNMPYKVKRN